MQHKSNFANKRPSNRDSYQTPKVEYKEDLCTILGQANAFRSKTMPKVYIKNVKTKLTVIPLQCNRASHTLVNHSVFHNGKTKRCRFTQSDTVLHIVSQIDDKNK
ncbi:MAG: hypothetical protein EZS28_020417 [Streblomastix strix]|uniref:Uncharacterized protein n=1 Tax=Streblomastix strix TaxID=222440 RepID=A0A5J4VN21_9EUKA|nr:MAG: hypothetical protein EZS28_020417 [Streblomastix strix]